MNDLPNIVWPEDGADADNILAATQALLGDHPWLVFVPNPRPFDTISNQIASRIGAEIVRVNNSAAFILKGQHSAIALRTFFETGAPEWAVLGFAKQPTTAMIDTALCAPDAEPARRLLLFDSNSLTTVI